jgi:hypothetical protein
MKQYILLKTSTINICKIALAAIIPAAATSCMMLTSAIPVEKLPEPFKSQIVQVKIKQEIMGKHFSGASIKMNDAYISIFKGCGMEKEAQQLKVNNIALQQASSSSERNKLIKRGNALIAEGQTLLIKSNNQVLASKKMFMNGYRQKDEAYMDYLSLLDEASKQMEDTRRMYEGRQDPMAAMAMIASLDPVIVLVKDIVPLVKNQRKFNEQTALIGKKYSCPLPNRVYKTAPSTKMIF